MAWTQARRRLRWSSFSEKTFWLLVNSARMSFLCHPRRKEDQTHPAFPRQPSQGPTDACGRQRVRQTRLHSSNAPCLCPTVEAKQASEQGRGHPSE